MTRTYKISVSVVVLVIAFAIGLVGLVSVRAATAIDLGAADSFAILSGTPFIANTGSSVITGDVGLSPATGAGITGFPPGTVIGTIYAVDAAGPAGSVEDPTLLTAAKNALTAAYLDAAGQTPVSTIGSEIGGTIIGPGAYDTADGEIHITGTVTLDGGGDPNAIFIFKAASTITTAAASHVSLINGAQACNIYWQVGSSATLGTDSVFKGNLLSLTSITLTTGAQVEGRLLARNGAVTLDSNVITKPTCSAPTTATLHVIKSVVNISGGAAVPADFMVHVTSATSSSDISGSPQTGTSTPGTLYTLSPGAYTISEDANASYTQSFGGACVPSGGVTLAAGDDKICTIINTDIPPPPAPVVSSGGGGFVPLPLIAVTKVPSPLALPAGPGSVTYTYTATNVGQVAMGGVWVKDNQCTPVTLISGDNNHNSLLDLDEAWVYRCVKTVSKTITNTATAHGSANGWDGYDTADATVVVGMSVPPPLIKIVKVPSILVPLPFGGGDVTYTYTVTNPGVAALHDVVVTDDKCAPVSRTSGDINGDTLLNPGEAWAYTCATNVSISTRNTATAEGRANGLVALDYAFATVAVVAPGLPNTGLSEGTMVVLLLSGILVVVVSTLLLVVLRKRPV